MGHLEAGAIMSVQNGQQESAQLFFGAVVLLANGGLPHLGKQGLGKLQQDPLHSRVVVETVENGTQSYADGRACCLNHGLVVRGAAAQQKVQAHHALVPGHGDLGGVAIFQNVHPGNDGCCREINMSQIFAWGMQNLSYSQLDNFKMGLQCGMNRIWK